MNRSADVQLFFLLVALVVISPSCQQQQDIPLPAGESVYAQPHARPLKFSAPENINWVPPQNENPEPPEIRHVDFSKIPSRPINAGSFHAITHPLPEKKFNWNQLADTSLNWDRLPVTPVEIEIFVLPEPETIPVATPKVRPDELTGIASLGLNEGLPAARIDDITQDAFGIIWFINDGKLFRYDGAVVQKFTLQGNPVLISVMRDKKGLIWVGTDNQAGLFVVDPKSRIQWHVKIPASVFVVKEDTKGQYWVGSLAMGVFILDWQNKTSKQLLLDKADKIYNTGNTVLDIYEDKKGQVWLASNAGIKIINTARNRINTLTIKEGLHTNEIWKISPDSRGRLWLGSRDYPGISILYPDEGRMQYAGPAIGCSKFIINALEAPDNTIYLPSDSLVYVIDPELTAVKTIPTNANYKSRIWYAHSIMDQSGQIWLGSINNGLHLIDTRGILPVYLDKSKGLGGDAIWGLMEDHNNQLWMGIAWTYPEKTGKVNRLDLTTSRIYDYTPVLDTPIVNMYTAMEDHQHRIWLGLYGKGIYILDFAKNTVTVLGKEQGLLPWGSAILQDRRKQIWLGQANGIVLLDSGLQVLQQYNEIVQGKESTIVSIQEDDKQQIWVATTGNGIYRIDSSRTNIQHLGTGEGLAGPDVNGLKIDNEGRPWVATNKGLTVIDDTRQNLYTLSPGQGLIDAACFSLINVKGNMAVGTAKGLTIFTPQKPAADTAKKLLLTVRSFDRNQGLAYLGFNTASGTGLTDGRMAFGIDSKVLGIFDQPANDTVSSPVYVSGILLEGKPLILPDNKSLLAWLQEKDTLRDEAGSAYYTTTKLPADTEYFSRKDIKWTGVSGPYNLPAELKLRSYQNYLQFQFAGMHYRDRDKVRYRYILEGVDRKWSDFTDKQITEPYRDLPPGTYTFKVAALTTSGRWSQSDPYNFTILPPWWKTSWAYIAYGLLVITCISGLVRLRSRQLKRKNLILEEKIRLRTHELQESIAELKNAQSQLIQAEKMASLGELTAGIAHEIKNPLNFVNNFAEINKELLEEMSAEIEKGNFEEVKNLANDVIENEEKIMHHGKRADDIVQGMLQHSRSSVGVKEPTDINILAEEYLRLAYHGLRAKDKSFHANLKTDFDAMIGLIQVIPQDIGRVILNLITNAFYAINEKKREAISAYEPTIRLSTRRIGERIEIRVSDNGKGIPQNVMDKIFQPFFTTKPTGQGTGLGLSLSYDIVKAHGGELKVETEEGLGATFIIQLPLT